MSDTPRTDEAQAVWILSGCPERLRQTCAELERRVTELEGLEIIDHDWSEIVGWFVEIPLPTKPTARTKTLGQAMPGGGK